jgi:hypothetical protein
MASDQVIRVCVARRCVELGELDSTMGYETPRQKPKSINQFCSTGGGFDVYHGTMAQNSDDHLV